MVCDQEMVVEISHYLFWFSFSTESLSFCKGWDGGWGVTTSKCLSTKRKNWWC